MQFPIERFRITSPFGWRNDPITGFRKEHKGVDISPTNDSWYIRPMLYGIIRETKYSPVWGNSILIEHSGRVFSFYAHCARTYYQPSDLVTEASVVALMGSTGRSTGAHLHFGVRVNGVWVDPIAYIKERIDVEEIKAIVQGKEMPAFLYNGTTYIPLRPYAAIHGEEVTWDGVKKVATVTGGALAKIIEIVEGVR